ncbi:P-loop NTPase fold protein [Chitinophagaceae bacterium MMS25-I14]
MKSSFIGLLFFYKFINHAKRTYNIPFDGNNRRFIQHLNLEHNDRVIFSGKFGMGKTTFLEEFFKKENQEKKLEKEKYRVIKLFPINYSIASNEDIFRYIKHDILYEMLENGYEINERGKSYLQTSLKFFLKNIHKIGAAFVRMMPLIGKDVAEAFDKFDKLKEEYLDFHDKDAKGDTDKILEYLTIEKNAEGLFEEGEITKIIQAVLQNKEEGQETVLLIDDLDRVDPEHIFRILNVFAAHFDVRRSGKKDVTLKNKFGFDKIIVVCDIQNIRNIFKARYGTNTDFNGYIDKFYSYEIFEYSIRAELSKLIRRKLSDADWANIGGDNPQLKRMHESHYFNRTSIFDDLIDLLAFNNQIDLRNILKWNNLKIRLPSIVQIAQTKFDIESLPIIFYFSVLSQIKGDFISLKEALLKCDNRTDNTTLVRYIKDLIYILTTNNHKQEKTDRVVLYSLNGQNVSLQIKWTEGKQHLIWSNESNTTQPFLTNSDFIWMSNQVIDFIISNIDLAPLF